MFHDSFNFPSVLKGERLAERVRLMRENPNIARKVAELEQGRRPIVIPRLAAPQRPHDRPIELTAPSGRPRRQKKAPCGLSANSSRRASTRCSRQDGASIQATPAMSIIFCPASPNLFCTRSREP
jgi:hypothetical protein